ncbi:hypothetical protein ACO0RG_003981 [Hanseniaspora osmophila]
MTVFLGVYKAVYAYEPQAAEELKIDEDDILYLLQKSDVDDWWTVKKRVIGSDAEEPSGLVPSNYIEEMAPIGQVKALYDYDQVQNPEEELQFHENDLFDLYDENDPDWLLCKNLTDKQYGFVPGNYVEKIDGSAGGAAPSTTTPIATAPPAISNPPASFLPPPVRLDREQYSSTSLAEEAQKQTAHVSPEDEHNKRTEVPPPSSYSPPPPTQPTRPIVDEDDYSVEMSPPRQPTRPTNTQASKSKDFSKFKSWKVNEVVGRKKLKANLSIGNNTIVFSSTNSPDDQPEQWDIKDLITYSNEKKHLFLDLSNPPASLELHTGSTDVANDIMRVLGEVKGGATSQMLNEVKEASNVDAFKNKSSSLKQGKVIYDFIAESPDELTIKSGDIVYILNDSNSNDWWLCELANKRGTKGVVPAQFIKPVNQLSSLAQGGGEDADDYYLDNKDNKSKHHNHKDSKAKKLFRSLTGRKSKYTTEESDEENDTRSRSNSRSAAKDDYFSGLPTKATSSGPSGNNNYDSYDNSNNSYNNDFSKKEEDEHLSTGQKLKAQLTGSWKSDMTNTSKKNSSRKRSASTSSKKKKDKEYPNAEKVRTWVDKSGTFKVEAEFIGCSQGKVHLHKINGVKIAVPADKLSLGDVEFVERATGFSLDKYKDQKPLQDSTMSPSKNDDAHASRDRERERRRKAREREERDRDRSLREQELDELRRARDMLDEERRKMRAEKERAREKDLPPVKPPRPDQQQQQQPLSSSRTGAHSNSSKPPYDWFEFFLNCGVDVNNCQRYTINFEREDISEDILPEVQPSLLRTLGLKEGDVLRVMRFLDNKFGRVSAQLTGAPTGGLFTEADGSLKVNSSTPATALPAQQPSSGATQTQQPVLDEDAWTVKPAANNNLSGQKSAQFSGSMQDLLDLEPLQSTASPTPALLKDLKPVATSSAPALTPSLTSNNTGKSIGVTKTGNALNPDDLIPLNPFKTGGNNVLPMYMMPVMTGGPLMMPMSTTGGAMMPQTTFGAGLQPVGTASNGGFILPVQKTGNGLVPANFTGGTAPFPQTSFGTGLQQGLTGNNVMQMPQLSFGQPQMTGGAMPQNTFGQPQITGGAMPQNTFGQPQMTGGAMPQNTFGQPQMTGGAMPQNTFGQPAFTGGAMPQNTFGQPQMTGSILPQQTTNGFIPQSTFGMTLQKTGGVAPLPQTSFNSFNQPQTNSLNSAMQNMNIYNHQQPLQNQPTGFGFGNGPQQQPMQQQQTGRANLFNASADNPFGF